MVYNNITTDGLEFLDREDLLKIVKNMVNGGIAISFNGKRTAEEIYKKVRPRVTRVDRKLCVGNEEEQSKNLIIEGENLQAMVTLYKYREQVDLIVTDPPYNTGGQHFRYNDKWDTDPNDPDLGTIVAEDDGSKHTKWMKAMMPRLQMMWKMLKPNGVIAICIDDNELFHLGMMMDEVFGEENRIGIINWQKSYSPKNDTTHVSTATEYVLVYAKDRTLAKTGLLPRDASTNSKYKNPDNDPEGLWRNSDSTAARVTEKDRYAIQSPFTGALHYPGSRSWTNPKKSMKRWLEDWGLKYEEKKLNDNRPNALIIKGAPIPYISKEQSLDNNPVVEDESVYNSELIKKSRELAENIRDNNVWPTLYFTKDGVGRPAIKRHLKSVKRGKVPLTFWADEEYEVPFILGAQSWAHQESGHSQSGINELDEILGKGHNFQTVKPLKLIKKIIQLWCPPKGLVLDPYAGSGTTGHAVLELNKEAETERRFILIEQGNSEKGDKYARSITAERLRRVISGERPNENGYLEKTTEPIKSGFEFRVLMKKIDAQTVLTMKKDELIDVVITSHWENERRASSNLIRIDDENYKYLVGRNDVNEGYFIIWNGLDQVGELNLETYETVVNEAKRAGLNTPYHVYARYEVLQTKSVRFYKIPDKILTHLGLNENTDPFNESEVSN
ncbi:site-specific DNA-methyltransferase [Paucisalibacillus globulus]|uniref:site-specific DNA-methyltransferase n=1 Tax=Paucisalibacillus globulus TaxID=351095 RepID=UPI000BB6A56C|nr:site-specific DNA-methyltransferase [Paucisalibacillus globulus]